MHLFNIRCLCTCSQSQSQSQADTVTGMDIQREREGRKAGPIFPIIFGLFMGVICSTVSLYLYFSPHTSKESTDEITEKIPYFVGAAVGVLIILLSGWRLVKRCKKE